MYYKRSEDGIDLAVWQETVSFFSETGQLGVIGSFIEDKFPEHSELFTYKNYYLLHALESEVLLDVLEAMEQKMVVHIEGCTSKGRKLSLNVLPLRIYVSVQSGRRYVMCWFFKAQRIIFCRLDNLERVEKKKPVHDYEKYHNLAKQMEKNLWGVSIGRISDNEYYEHVELIVCANKDEPYILQCLEREKRCGRVEKIMEGRYRFVADVRDAGELLPWLRTFIGRIESFTCSNKTEEEKFWQDLQTVYAMYMMNEDGKSGNEYGV